MRPATRKLVVEQARRWIGDSAVQRVLDMPFEDLGHGYDSFGQERESAILAWLAARWLYTHWFRVESAGCTNVPREGAAILAANHSGLLPFDGMMIGVDLLERDPPRLMRGVAEFILSDVPFFSGFVYRAGQVIGHRRNFEQLLRHGDLVAVFPEGAKGMAKRWRERYRLADFNVGFVELALTHRVPIIPAAVVGAAEQIPVVGNLRSLAKRIGVPILPIIPGLLLGPIGVVPLPVKYHIAYGKPLALHERYGPEAIDDVILMRSLAGQVQARVQQMIDDKLRARRGVFR